MAATARDPVFEIVSGMEDDIKAVQDFAQMLLCVAVDPDLEEHHATIIQRIAFELHDRIKGTEEDRGKLWRTLHPLRDEYERNGWSGDAKPETATTS
jgi:hypothetical protein